jgi:serpin B
MAQTLQLGGLSVSQLNDDNAALLASLMNPDPQVTLTVANSLWVDLSSSPVSAAFTSTDQTYYGAEIGDLAGAPADVNAWGNAQTHGLIPKILTGPLQDVVAIVANLVYFKGSWEYAFDPSQTKMAPFTLADGTQTSVSMMSQTDATFPMLSGTNFTAVALPYGQGRFSMIVVLPNPGVDFDTFISTVTPADVQSWVSQMVNTSPMDLSLPRFTTKFVQSLNTPLTTLGMGVAFGGGADLSGMYPGAFISFVQHSTVVEVDETGTVAAGATVIGTGIEAAQPPVTVDINHPFFYAIRDNQTGALLFTGVLMNPNAG